MSLQPTITFPTNSPGYSTNLEQQTIRGTTDPTTESIIVNGSTDGVSYVSGDVSWTFVTLLEEGENIYSVRAVDNTQVPSIPLRRFLVIDSTQKW